MIPEASSAMIGVIIKVCQTSTEKFELQSPFNSEQKVGFVTCIYSN